MKFSIQSFQERLKLFPGPTTDKSDAVYPCVRISEDLVDQAYQWCEDQYGYEWIWSNRLQTDYVDIYFLNEQDALLFKLRFDTV